MDPRLLDSLPAPRRLALAYAGRAGRGDWLALLAFDARLGAIVRQAREPLLGQVRLAWWRDRLGQDPADWPAGEPLLAALRGWQPQFAALAALVDGWELLLGAPPLPSTAFAQLADARAEAFAELARRVGEAASATAAHRAARAWALADLLDRVSDAEERESLTSLMQRADPTRLPRAMRPLAVLGALARRGRSGPLDLLVAMRAGLSGG